MVALVTNVDIPALLVNGDAPRQRKRRVRSHSIFVPPPSIPPSKDTDSPLYENSAKIQKFKKRREKLPAAETLKIVCRDSSTMKMDLSFWKMAIPTGPLSTGASSSAANLSVLTTPGKERAKQITTKKKIYIKRKKSKARENISGGTKYQCIALLFSLLSFLPLILLFYVIPWEVIFRIALLSVSHTYKHLSTGEKQRPFG